MALADLQGKHVVVTGASRGIGRAVSVILRKAGMNVSAGARSRGDLLSLEREAGVTIFPLDVRNPSSVSAFSQRVLARGPVDMLVNNAGIGIFKAIEELSIEDWDSIFEINVRGSFLITQSFLASITKQQGKIIMVTADASTTSIPLSSLYSAAIEAQRTFTKALRQEVAPFGVTVTDIRPGVVSTHFAGTSPREADEEALSPVDVAEGILFAISRPARMRLDTLQLQPLREGLRL